jgi:aminoglycoside phosphotransferase
MRSRNQCRCGKTTIIKYSECVPVALVTRHAKRMRYIILSGVACPDVTYSSTLSHKWCDFRKKVTEHKMCDLILSTTFVRNTSHSKKNRVRYKCTHAIA